MDTQKISQNIFTTRSLSSTKEEFSDNGSVSLSLERNVKTALENCYSSVVTQVVCVIKRMLSPATKDLPVLLNSAVIYKY